MKNYYRNVDHKIRILEEYLKSEYGELEENKKYDIPGNLVFEGVELGKWIIITRHEIKTGKNKNAKVIDAFEKYGLIEGTKTNKKTRIERLTSFVKKYPRLWYDPKNFESSLLIYVGEHTVEELREMHNQAYIDYSKLRAYQKQLSKDDCYTLAEAGVGGVFGLSEKAEEERKYLICNTEIDESIADRIIRYYGSIDTFNQVFLEGYMTNDIEGRISNIVYENVNFITEFNLGDSAVVSLKNKNYAEFLKRILKMNSNDILVYNGNNSIRELINKTISKLKPELQEKTLNVVLDYFGLNGHEKINNYRAIARKHNISFPYISRIILDFCERCRREEVLLQNCMYFKKDTDISEYFTEYFKNHNCFYTADKFPINREDFKSFVNEFLVKNIDNVEMIEKGAASMLNLAKKIGGKDEEDINEKIYSDQVEDSEEYAMMMLRKKIEVSESETENETVTRYVKQVKKYIAMNFGSNMQEKDKYMRILNSRAASISNYNKIVIMSKLEDVEGVPDRVLVKDLSINSISDDMIGVPKIAAIRRKYLLENAGLKYIEDLRAFLYDYKTHPLKNCSQLYDELIPWVETILKNYGCITSYSEFNENNDSIDRFNQIILKSVVQNNINRKISFLENVDNIINYFYLNNKDKSEIQKQVQKMRAQLQNSNVSSDVFYNTLKSLVGEYKYGNKDLLKYLEVKIQESDLSSEQKNNLMKMLRPERAVSIDTMQAKQRKYKIQMARNKLQSCIEAVEDKSNTHSESLLDNDYENYI